MRQSMWVGREKDPAEKQAWAKPGGKRKVSEVDLLKEPRGVHARPVL